MNGVVPDARRPAPGPLRLVQDFCNSVDFEGGWDDLDTADGLARWLVSHDFPAETPQPPDPHLARRAREAFRDLLTVPANHPATHPADHPAPGGATASRPDRGRAVLGELAADLPLTVVIGETLTIAPARPGLPGALAAMLAALAIAALDGTAARLKVCEADSCRWVFYDESRNGSSRWCSMQLCGARNKNRAYRQRRRAGT